MLCKRCVQSNCPRRVGHSECYRMRTRTPRHQPFTGASARGGNQIAPGLGPHLPKSIRPASAYLPALAAARFLELGAVVTKGFGLPVIRPMGPINGLGVWGR